MSKNLSTAEIDVVILCGGKGERLQLAISDRPKSLADIGGRPFLDLILEYAVGFGFLRFILCTGYLGQQIEDYCAKKIKPRIFISREETPLGTGGAIKNAADFIRSNPFLVLNGDTYCPMDPVDLINDYSQKNARHEVVVVEQRGRRDIGRIRLGQNREVVSFVEKEDLFERGLANAGIYLFDSEVLDIIPNRQSSLERDILPVLIGKDFYGYPTDAKCFDIGTPERYLQFLKNRGRIGNK